MRIAFAIKSAGQEGQTSIHFFNASEMQESPTPLIATWNYPQGAKATAPVYYTSTLDVWQRRVMAFVGGVVEEHGNSALLLVRALVGLGAKQVVWDPTQGKYRNISTAKKGETTWQLVGTKVSYEAEDEKDALAKAPHKLMRAMQADPANATSLAKWFDGGKVKALETNDLPKAIAIEALANGAQEVKLAATPIPKISRKKEDEEA